jgi:4-aminobutyrate aminotransferase
MYMQGELHRLANRHLCIGDVRGKGLMISIELIDTHGNKNSELRDKIIQMSFERGLLILGCGENNVRFSPPLVITRSHVDTCINILEEILDEVS